MHTTTAAAAEVLMVGFVTHDVNRYVVEKPPGYTYQPGQAARVALDQEGLRDEKHPFTFTSLTTDKVLEFTIKSYPTDMYPDHLGITERLSSYTPGERLLLGEAWGTITYKGLGLFIAGGAGMTLFMAILRDLQHQGKVNGNALIFSNKRKRDVLLEKEWREMFSPDCLMLTLTQEHAEGYASGRVDAAKIKRMGGETREHFYVCGPKSFVRNLTQLLVGLGVSSQTLVIEE